MIGKWRTIGAATLVGLGAVVACGGSSDDDKPKDNGDAGAGGDNGSSGGSKAGTAGHGGTFVPRAGSSSTGGGAGTDASTAGQGQGGADACPGCASGFCLADGTCVDCLASNDQCPTNHYCTDAHECALGCKTDGSNCASGVCSDDHNCKGCINDDECTGGLVCGAGQCNTKCDAAAEGQRGGCDTDLICCSTHCTDLAVDSAHCGVCGTACSASQFCGLSACHETTLANICNVGEVIVILDTTKNDSDGNRVPGRAIGAAIKAQCASAPKLTEAEQDSVEALNLATGRPVSSSNELLIVAGGPFYQNLEGYVEEQHIAPLYLKGTGDATEFRKSANDAVVVSLPTAGDHDAHDFFLIQFMRDAESGSLVLNAQGFWLSGTVAATYQIKTAVLPNLASYNKAWYVYEWTDANADKAPDANEIVLTDSGL